MHVELATHEHVPTKRIRKFSQLVPLRIHFMATAIDESTITTAH